MDENYDLIFQAKMAENASSRLTSYKNHSKNSQVNYKLNYNTCR